MRRLLPLLLLSACTDLVEEDLPGQLVRVTVSASLDDCRPERFVGDAGVQFFGVRPDGGLVFTMAQQAQFGPTLDGGALESVQRQTIPSFNGGRATVGGETGCAGSFSAWDWDGGVLGLSQEWPGATACPSGPSWLPTQACTSSRRFALTQVGSCQLRCVKLSVSGEVDCAC